MRHSLQIRIETRTLEKARTEMTLHVLAYNLKRAIAMKGVQPLIEAMRSSGPERRRPLHPSLTI